MAATGVYITQTDVERRLTAELLRTVFDDDGDGTLESGEEGALSDMIADAENLVEEAIKKTYGPAGLTWARGKGTDAPRSIKRRCLDGVRLYIFERHPEFIRIDFNEAWKRHFADLDRLKLREVEMATAEGDNQAPAQNEGGVVRSGDPDSTTPRAKIYLDGMGIF